MKQTARIISMLALAATILPSLLFFADRISLAQAKTWMLIAMVVWYVSAPLWMQIKPSE
jgi:hypothetical protein